MRLGESWKRAATRLGLVAALASVLLWPIYAAAQGHWRVPFTVALFLTALSGISLLLITGTDMLTVRRSRHARPARLFDLAFGALLAVPAGLALDDLLKF